MTEHQRRIARARLLRREGKSYAEIRALLGPVTDDRLERWLIGIARPPGTLRGRARDDLRRECRRLRADGLTIGEIARLTGASKGSVSPWVSDVAAPPHAQERRSVAIAETRRRIGDANRRRGEQRRDDIRLAASAELGPISGRDLFIAGLALYWAEGVKDKPWRREGRVTLINSDPDVLSLFLRWLDLVDVADEDRGYRLHIHQSADVPSQETWWSERLHIPLLSFKPATLKRHNPKTVRHNTDEHYHGCLIVSVRRSSRLYYSIEGWWRAMTHGLDRIQADRANSLSPTCPSRVV